ncbi:MAG TPA: lytic transglycosylase domain-containing protein, partial [Bdellovibrionota bacterium]|nr:lytic transglycosylase domain-containing protein [Bdellovibrionota bacterium]
MMMMTRRTLPILLLLSFVSCVGASKLADPPSPATAERTAAAKAEFESERKLSEVLESGLTGLSLLTADEKARVLAEAAVPQAKVPFIRQARDRGLERRARLLARALKKGDLTPFAQASDAEISKAVRSLKGYSQAMKVVPAILAEPECTHGALSQSLASRAEEDLPDEARRTEAIALYSRASRCTTGDIRDRAQYRLGLLHLSRGDCTLALPPLAALVTRPEARDYHSRAWYWQWFCAEKSGNSSLSADARKTLLKEFPLSYHAILINGSLPEALRSWAGREDSPVLLRSKWVPELNPAVELMEAWLELKQGRRILLSYETLMPNLAEAEPQFQLYFGVLLHRAGHYPAKFRTLAPLFRQNPELVSKAALKLLYPHRDFTAEFSPGSSPLLLLSLIRQESAFDPRARSSAGALGLMQIMPRTGRRMAGVRARELLEPGKNVRIGSRFFAKLVDRFGGDVELALASYNAGPVAVEGWVRRYPVADRVLFLDLI